MLEIQKIKKGKRSYTRLSFSIYDNWNECSKFKTKDEAQRNFLKNGGPYKDRFNLDPDGDGFACDWDPDIYRELSIPKIKKSLVIQKQVFISPAHCLPSRPSTISNSTS